ncbi:hypothetical protein BH18CHL1_BH18CHL1_03530 [soil metagenome]
MPERSIERPAPRFGLFLGQAGSSWSRILERFEWAEELGFDQAFLVDHLQPTDGSDEEPVLEAWSLLAALAARTSRLRIGVLVTSNTFRHPAVLAKQAVTVDHISGGRLILGLGTGWHEPEHRHYGVPFPKSGERVSRLAETVELIDSLMRHERTTFHGRQFTLDDAPFQPRSVQQPRVPFLIAAHRPRTLAIAARFADIWDTFPATAGTATEGNREDIAGQVRRFERLCRESGRHPARVRRSTWTGGQQMTDPSTYRAFVEDHARLGFTDFTTGLPPPADEATVRTIATDVIPDLRARLAGRPRTPG